MLSHHGPKAVNPVRNAVVSPGQRVEIRMYTFGPLFSHEAKANSPLLQPWNHMLLQNVHFRKHCSLWEFRSVELHERFDAGLCEST